MNALKHLGTFALLGSALVMLSACMDPEEESRNKQAQLLGMSCAALSTEAAVTNEKIRNQTDKASTAAIAAAFSSGETADRNRLNSTLAQTIRRDLENDLQEIRLVMARRGCN